MKFILSILLSFSLAANSQNLFFSEYGEGNSSNKYLEIYNPNSFPIYLNSFALAMVSNAPTEDGEYEFWIPFNLNDVIPANDVFVIADPNADSEISANNMMTYSYLSNGDDGYCLVSGSETNYVVLDCIGDWNGDPGSGWTVAGIPDATRNHTLIRKPYIYTGASSNWQISAGTNSSNSQWIVYEQDYWENIGIHSTSYSSDSDSTNIGVNVLPCGSAILTVNNANSASTNGGVPSEERRAIYTYEHDSTSMHSYIGENFPYIKVKNGLIIQNYLQNSLLNNLNFTIGSDSILLINNKPVYQFIGDYSHNDTYGNFGPWKLITSNGIETNTPCAVPGCIDSYACNYTSGLWSNNNNCIYPPFGLSCDGICLNENATKISFYNYDYGITIENCEGNIIFESSENFQMDNINSVCIENLPNAYNIYLDSTLINVENSESITDFGWQNEIHKYLVNSCPIYGCISQDALNYNPSADTDDGSCILPIYGCTDTNAVNFNPNANVNMACIFAGCTDPSAENYDSQVTQDDGSCCYGQTCAPIIFQGFEPSDNWTYTSNPEFYDFNNGDAFDIMSGEYQNMMAASGNSFLAFQDILNPNAPLLGNQSTSLYYHYLTFATIQILQPSSVDLKLSFSYLAHELDATDYMAYELQFNNDDTWNSDWISSVDTSFAFSAYLSKSTDDLWVTHTIDIPDTVSFVRFRIGAYQNGGADWGGFDDFSLFFDGQLLGCTDPTAFNYNPQAAADDGSCIPVVLGCMDFFADNYNSEANTDGGCIYYGCTYANSINYDPTANTDDGSCIDAVYGCTDEDADNYYSEANVDNGQCQYFGCIDPTACNFDASKNADDGTCYYLSLELTKIDNSCSGGLLGQITSNVIGGFGNLSYSWNAGEDSEDLFNLSAGDYVLTVSDQNGCTVSESATISEPSIDAELFSPEICYITVDDNTGFNKIIVNPINHEAIGGYVIYKEVLTDTYYPIATLDANTLEYVDSTSNPLINSDRYKVNVIDNCLFESEQSEAHRTVHLSMNAGLNNSVNLIWNKYDGFDVSSYMIFRGQSVSNMEFVGFIAGSQSSYTDLNPPVGTSIYQVRVVAPICNPISSNPNASFAQVADTLKSNVVEHDYIRENDDLGVNIIVNNPSCETCNDGSLIAQPTNGLPAYSTYWSNGIIGNFNFGVGPGTYTVYVSDANGVVVSETVTLTAESSDILGCTDPSAGNYNPEANMDDGSCHSPIFACDIAPSGLFVDNIIHERVAFNWSAPTSAPSYYMIRYRPVGTSSWTVMSAGPQNDVPFTGTSRTRYFMEPGTTYQWNIRARVVDENGATVCQSPWSASHQYTTLPACANLTDLSVNSEANLVYFNANRPSGEWAVWQAKGKIREVGSNNFKYLPTTVDSYSNQIKYNFTPSTDYEWHTKAWCTGNVDEDGNSDPQYHSGWGEFSAFTTQDPCDKLPTNLSTTSGNNANTAITMSWDTPTSGQPHHYFLELTNETTGQVFSWNNLAGSSTSKTKYGQSSGDQFKWRIRGACGENGTSWATPFTTYEYYTLGGDRLGNDSQSNSQLTNISVYPNPSRGEFNISFDLGSRQDVYLSITNYLGEVIFTEELKDLEGQYNKNIDLGNKANGIYMLKITTNNQNINQKIVIQ